MQLAKDIENQVKEAKTLRLSWRGKLCWGVVCVIIIWLLDHLGRDNLALATMNSVGVLGFAIALKWKLKRYPWFWITMTLLAALHIPLILFVPWTTRWVPALAIAAIDSVDLIVILVILSAVGKFMERPKTAEG